MTDLKFPSRESFVGEMTATLKDHKPLSPGAAKKRLKSFRYVLLCLLDGLEGNPFSWGKGESDAYLPKARSMGFTLLTHSILEQYGYHLKRNVEPVGTVYFGSRRYGKMYIVEVQRVKNKMPADQAQAVEPSQVSQE